MHAMYRTLASTSWHALAASTHAPAPCDLQACLVLWPQQWYFFIFSATLGQPCTKAPFQLGNSCVQACPHASSYLKQLGYALP